MKRTKEFTIDVTAPDERGNHAGGELELFVEGYEGNRRFRQGPVDVADLLKGLDLQEGNKIAITIERVEEEPTDLNVRVSLAIHRAEELTRETSKAWDDVASAEDAIASANDMPAAERGFAKESASSARCVAAEIKQIARLKA